MQTILILGDCQSNCNDCFADEIMNQTSPRTWSLRYHNEFPKVFKWYLKHRKDNNVKTPMPTSNLQGEVWNYLQEVEANSAWPYLLSVPNIVNISINGGHFIGHHYRLKKYLANNPKPDHILITDYTFSHIAHAFKHEGKQYVFERASYKDQDWNSEAYPIEVHKKRLAGLEFQLKQDRNWHIRRHKKGYDMLIKFINHHNIPWSVVRFGDFLDCNTEVFDTIMNNEIDCKPFYKEYTVEIGQYPWIKLKLQKEIAKKVQEYIDRL